jgi:DNA-binding transcriptional ArsR family regulator
LLLNPDELRIPPETVSELLASARRSKRPPRHQPDGEFLKGPIPLSWLAPAARLPGRTLVVALALWFQCGRTNCRRVSLTGSILERFGVKRLTMYHGLRALEQAGLVAMERQTGKNPTVTILDQAESLEA